ncbi:MAG: hypothetical protein ACI9VR_000047 [Cognaticolwellia sp.]|jgi:hypothetical protein
MIALVLCLPAFAAIDDVREVDRSRQPVWEVGGGISRGSLSYYPSVHLRRSIGPAQLAVEGLPGIYRAVSVSLCVEERLWVCAGAGRGWANSWYILGDTYSSAALHFLSLRVSYPLAPAVALYMDARSNRAYYVEGWRMGPPLVFTGVTLTRHKRHLLWRLPPPQGQP